MAEFAYCSREVTLTQILSGFIPVSQIDDLVKFSMIKFVRQIARSIELSIFSHAKGSIVPTWWTEILAE